MYDYVLWTSWMQSIWGEIICIFQTAILAILGISMHFILTGDSMLIPPNQN